MPASSVRYCEASLLVKERTPLKVEGIPETIRNALRGLVRIFIGSRNY